MTNISAIVLTKDSEKYITRCIDSVSFADEVIVIDDFSSDQTVTLARKKHAKVYKRRLNNDFSAQRNDGISKASSEWVLFVDSDEIISNKLATEIIHAVKTASGVNGFYLKRYDVFFEKVLQHGEIGHVKLLRLGRRGSGVFDGDVHETWNINGETKSLSHPIFHYAHESVGSFIADVDLYSTIRARELYKEKNYPSFLDIVLYPLGKFFMNFFLRRGFLDGMEGLIYAILMSFHSFLVKGKLWMLHHETKTNTA